MNASREGGARSGAGSRLRALVLAAVAALAVIAVHGQAIRFDFVNWDDSLYVTENPAVLSPSTVPISRHLLTPSLGYPIPVTVATYIAESAVFGLNPAVFHATNVALHLTVTWLILWGLRWAGCGSVVAAVAALGFALHPAAVEPVVWVSGRKELLAAIFSLASLLLMTRVLQAGSPRVRERLWSAGLVILAALSKPSAAFLPVLFAGMDRRAGRVLWAVVQVLLLGVVGVGFLGQREVGALSSIGGFEQTVRRVLATAGHHAAIIVQPFDLAPKYLDPPQGPEGSVLATGAVAIALSLGVAFIAWRRAHPAWPAVLFAWLTYLPSSGLVPLNRQYSDSYLYLPLAGLAMAAGLAIERARGRVGPAVRRAAIAAAACVLAVLAMESHRHAGLYRDGPTLWGELYARYPDSPQVCRNLGNAWMFGRTQRPDRAVAVYRHCIETLGQREFFLKNLAVATYVAGDISGAGALFEELARVRPDDPVVRGYLDRIEHQRNASSEAHPWTSEP